MAVMDPEMNSFDKLLFLNEQLFSMIETSVSLDLLARLYSSQVVTHGEKHLLDHNRVYYRLLRQIAAEGQERGQITRAASPAEVAKLYALCERALLYDWCICNGEYSLSEYSARLMPMFLSKLRG